MPYKFWLSKKEREMLNDQQTEANLPLLRKELIEAFSVSFLYSDKSSLVWSEVENGSVTLKDMIDSMNVAEFKRFKLLVNNCLKEIK